MEYTFGIIADDIISIFFRKLGCGDFMKASHYVKQLPYRRNKTRITLPQYWMNGVAHAAPSMPC